MNKNAGIIGNDRTHQLATTGYTSSQISPWKHTYRHLRLQIHKYNKHKLYEYLQTEIKPSSFLDAPCRTPLQGSYNSETKTYTHPYSDWAKYDTTLFRLRTGHTATQHHLADCIEPKYQIRPVCRQCNNAIENPQHLLLQCNQPITPPIIKLRKQILKFMHDTGQTFNEILWTYPEPIVALIYELKKLKITL